MACNGDDSRNEFYPFKRVLTWSMLDERRVVDKKYIRKYISNIFLLRAVVSSKITIKKFDLNDTRVKMSLLW